MYIETASNSRGGARNSQTHGAIASLTKIREFVGVEIYQAISVRVANNGPFVLLHSCTVSVQSTYCITIISIDIST